MDQDTSIPIGLQTLLTELDFLGQISKGKKPIMNDMKLIDNDSWFGWFYRAWWKRENRENVMSKIEQIVSKTVDAIVDHKHTAYIGIIVNKFDEAKNGIQSLLTTYDDDPKMIARVRVQLQNIDLQLKAYRHLIKGYKPADVPPEEKKEVKTEQSVPSDPGEVEILNLHSDIFETGSSEKRKLRRRVKRSEKES